MCESTLRLVWRWWVSNAVRCSCRERWNTFHKLPNNVIKWVTCVSLSLWEFVHPQRCLSTPGGEEATGRETAAGPRSLETSTGCWKSAKSRRFKGTVEPAYSAHCWRQLPLFLWPLVLVPIVLILCARSTMKQLPILKIYWFHGNQFPCTCFNVVTTVSGSTGASRRASVSRSFRCPRIMCRSRDHTNCVTAFACVSEDLYM